MLRAKRIPKMRPNKILKPRSGNRLLLGYKARMLTIPPPRAMIMTHKLILNHLKRTMWSFRWGVTNNWDSPSSNVIGLTPGTKKDIQMIIIQLKLPRNKYQAVNSPACLIINTTEIIDVGIMKTTMPIMNMRII